MTYRGIIACIAFIFICIITCTVKTNNKNKYKLSMVFLLLSYVIIILVSSVSITSTSIMNVHFIYVLLLIPVCIVGNLLSKRYLKVKERVVVKADTYSIEIPSNEDFINGYSIVKIEDNRYKLRGGIYSNKKNIVIGLEDNEYSSVEPEQFDFNTPVAQALFIMVIGLYYTSVDVTQYTIIGALLVLSSVMMLIRTKVKNKNTDLFLSIVYAIAFAVAILGAVLLLSNR